MATPYFVPEHRYTPQRLSETERRAKLLRLLTECKDDGLITDADAAYLFDTGCRIMRDAYKEWENK